MLSFITSRLCIALLAVAVSVAAFGIGHMRGGLAAQRQCADDRAEAERQAQVALAEAARRAVEADAAAAQQRAEAQRLARQVARSRDAKIAALPPSDCTVPADRRLLIRDTYCDRFPAASACVPRTVPDVPDRAASQ